LRESTCGKARGTSPQREVLAKDDGGKKSENRYAHFDLLSVTTLPQLLSCSGYVKPRNSDVKKG
jgi:hypothetical protein